MIFDFDGVIIDSEPLHKKAWKGVFKEKGILVKDEEMAEFIGTTGRSFLKRVNRCEGKK